MPKYVQRVGAAGQGQGRSRACVLVLGENAAVRVGRCTGQQRGCDVLHAPLMSFLGQARLWGKLINKQATERSPCSPLLLLLLLQLITLFMFFSIVFPFVFIALSYFFLQLPNSHPCVPLSLPLYLP